MAEKSRYPELESRSYSHSREAESNKRSLLVMVAPILVRSPHLNSFSYDNPSSACQETFPLGVPESVNLTLNTNGHMLYMDMSTWR